MQRITLCKHYTLKLQKQEQHTLIVLVTFTCFNLNCFVCVIYFGYATYPERCGVSMLRVLIII